MQDAGDKQLPCQRVDGVVYDPTFMDKAARGIAEFRSGATHLWETLQTFETTIKPAQGAIRTASPILHGNIGPYIK